MGITYLPPAPAQVEVSLFGPGYGESILVHLGGQQWVVIDSCVEPGSHEPAALEYLERIGVDAATAVRLVVASHWHDDHIKGLSRIIEVCQQARFACSVAFTKAEFITALSRFNKNNSPLSGSGAEELWKTFTLLKAKSPLLATAGRRILALTGDEVGHGNEAEVWALSPSDQQVERFLMEIATDLPEFRVTKFRAVAQSPNQGALVNLIKVGPLAVLLGSDLEEANNPALGWSAVIQNRDPLLPKAAIFKVAHHGSSNGHHDGVWTELLTDAPFALVTPWARGLGLPKDADVKRIVAFTPNGFITSPPRQSATKVQRDPAVERQIRETTEGKLRRAEPLFGQVRLRSLDAGFSKWSVELSPSAMPLEKAISAA